MSKRTHIVISERLATDIDRFVGKRGRSAFLSEAAEKELLRLRQLKALHAAAGSWKDKDHPESNEALLRGFESCGVRTKHAFAR